MERRYYRGHVRRLTLGTDYVEWGAVDARRRNEWVTADALSVLTAAGRVSV